MSTYRTRDQIVADAPDGPRGFTPELMCAAHGCPNRWSVDFGEKLCSFHDVAKNRHDWPRITQEQQNAETQRMMDRQRPVEAVRYVTPDPAKLRAYLSKLSLGVKNTLRKPRGWAEELRERHQAGEALTPAQITAYRDVLKFADEGDA